MTFDEQYDPVDIEDYLSHHGRKGMKWYQHIFGRLQEHAKYNKEAKRIVKENKSRNHKKLSDEELSRRISRLKIEKEYLDLNRDTRTTGKRVVDSVLGAMGKGTLKVIEDQTKNLGNKVVGDIIGEIKKKKK